MKKSAPILAWFIPVIFPLLLCAQEPAMLHYTKDDGLPSNTLYNVYSDSKGYLWFGTDKGVARYNGTSFETFTTNDGLPDNEIFFFKEDYEGRLWLATFNGKLCYFKDGVFHNEQNTPWLKVPNQCTHTRFITLGKDSTVIFEFNSLAYLVSLKGENLDIIPTAKIAKKIFTHPGTVLYIERQTKNRYRLLHELKSFIFDQNGKFISEDYHKHKNPLYAQLNSSGGVYLAFGDSVYNAANRYVCRLKGLKDTRHNIILEDTAGIFIGQEDGLYISDSIHLLSGNLITAIEKDFQGNFWISTHKNGVYVLSNNFRQTSLFIKEPDEFVTDALLIGKRLYYITTKGIIKRENGYAIPEVIFTPPQEYILAELYPKNKLLPDGRAILLAKDYLIVTEDITRSSKAYIPHYRHLEIKEILFDGRKNYFLGINYLSEGYTQQSLIKGLAHAADLKTLFSSMFSDGGRISTGVLDEKSNIWFQYRDSVFKISNDQLSFGFCKKNTFFRKMIVTHNYFIAFTDNNLLLVINRNKIPDITDTFRIPSLVWDNMHRIDDTHIFLSSNKDYYLLTLLPQKDQTLDCKLEAVENNFLPRQAEYIYIDSVYSFFFKNSGITRIETSLLLSATPPPRIGLMELQVRSQLYTKFDTIHCTYPDAKHVRLRFDAISFSSKELGYQYSISENDTDHWQDINSTELNLLFPSYGLYTIKVRAKTISSDYSAPATLTLIIGRPWWATWWFWTIAIATLIATIWGGVQWRTKRLLAKKQQEFEAEKRYQQAEYKALNALMNPHFIFNSMNNIQGLINEDEKQTANDYLVIFSEMIRQNMHNIDLGVISLQKELTLCRNYLELEKLRFKELINFSFEVEQDIDTEDIDIPPLLIQPLIENAIRHGLLPRQSKSSMVIIRITEKDNLLIIEVEDNGIGLTQAAQNKSVLHQSTGISNMQKRIEHIRKMKQRGISFNIAEIKEAGIVKGTLAVIKIELE